MWQAEVTSHIMQHDLFYKGLTLLKGFNREECAHTFEEITKLDQNNAFAHWVIAYCHGADYNMYGPIYEAIRKSSEWPSLEKAVKHAQLAVNLHKKDDIWNVIYEATRYRFQKLNLHEYASYLRNHISKFEKNDPMHYAIEAESLMILEPWKLWDQVTMLPTDNAVKVKNILNEGLKLYPEDEWLCHLKVHYCEMGPKEQFDYDVLKVLERSVNGHLKHMPSHIYIQIGNYEKSMELNKQAVVLDKVFRCISNSSLCLYSFYECHNFHFVVFAGCMSGDKESSVTYAKMLTSFVYSRMMEENPISTALCQAFYMIQCMVYIRFGEWDEIKNINIEEKDDLILKSFYSYAKAIAYAATSEIEKAEQNHELFVSEVKKIPDDVKLHNESVQKISIVAILVSKAEIIYRKNNESDEWIDILEQAIKLEGELAYDEPPAWMIPVRQTLVALLLESRMNTHYSKILTYIKEDLTKWPDNIWSLSALSRYANTYPVGDDTLLQTLEKLKGSMGTSCACALTHWKSEE